MAVKIDNLGTEKRNEKTSALDLLSSKEIITIMNQEDNNVIKAISEQIDNIDEVVKQCVKAYNNGGRIIYIGAGTSGRLGLMDAVEIVPTFNCERFVGLIAGGEHAFVKAVEGAEDSEELCVQDLKNLGFNDKDFLIGIAASGRTPYVIGGLKYARQIGVKTGCVCCNKNTVIGSLCDYPIEVDAGPEVLTGSTRLKSGTCQKIILNMISTATMVSVGKVYGNLMVDVKATNEKLVERCRRIVMEATGCDHDRADEALNQTNNDCKTAILMVLLNISAEEAAEKLDATRGNIRKALDQ